MSTAITDHAFHRTVERLGVPRKAVFRLADKAYAEGHRQHEFSGAFARFLGDLGRHYRTTPVVYHGHVYAFSGEVLITVYPLPRKFRDHKPRVKPTSCVGCDGTCDEDQCEPPV